MIRYSKIGSLLTVASLFCLTACQVDNKPVKHDGTIPGNSQVSLADSQVAPQKAKAFLSPTDGNKVSGSVEFNQEKDGVRITARVEGLTPGKHGFHVHEKGDCSAHDGSSAGGHFNPTHKEHGGPDSANRHVGDFGNLDADSKGVAVYDRLDTVIKLSGDDSIINRSIVVHADEDDLKSQPTGNSGARVACGVILAE